MKPLKKKTTSVLPSSGISSTEENPENKLQLLILTTRHSKMRKRLVLLALVAAVMLPVSIISARSLPTDTLVGADSVVVQQTEAAAVAIQKVVEPGNGFTLTGLLRGLLGMITLIEIGRASCRERV